ncbi:replicative DNA helicase [Streptomyces jeddahensis]|uniref:Replicative DNA helicase DnaB n=1 Tax=Streptomyces jeddahensis TaxID=1716141 RepID=A0A177HJ31_9ACTN|nr:replicative DNA helicase [Streptomyces jeddahensis]OAH10982.1 replicative DNA helicase [Streptomyces jeddahensis]
MSSASQQSADADGGLFGGEHGEPELVPAQRQAAAGFERVPPQDLSAEQSVLGGMLLSKAAIADVIEVIKGHEYYRPVHQTIHLAIVDMYGRGEPADPITVTAELTRRGELAKVGGAAYLHTLVQAVPTAAHAEHYAGIVRDCWMLRKAIEAGTRVTAMGYAQDAAPAEVVDAAASELLELQATFDVGKDPAGWDTPLSELLEEWEEAQAEGENPGLPMPYANLQRMLGTVPGHLVVIAGRPGMGKSVVLLDLMRHLAVIHGKPAAFVSLEMARRQIMNRLIAAEAEIPQHAVRTRSMDADQWKRYDRVKQILMQAPLRLIVPPGGITVAQIRSNLRRWAIEDQLPAALAVDYLQIVRPEAAKGANRTNEVDAIARGLKELALEFDIPIFAAAQLSRLTTATSDRVPQLSHLRESGEIEQAADAVVLLHREDYYEPEHERAGEIDLIVAKNREGSTGIVSCAFQGRFSRVRDMGVGT